MATGNTTEYKKCSYSFRKAIKQAKRQYRDKVCMWQCLQSITDYKKKTSPVADIDVLLPDKLNNFFTYFEDCWQCHRHRPLPKTVGSPSLWPTGVKHLNVFTLSRPPDQTAASDGSLVL